MTAYDEDMWSPCLANRVTALELTMTPAELALPSSYQDYCGEPTWSNNLMRTIGGE